MSRLEEGLQGILGNGVLSAVAQVRGNSFPNDDAQGWLDAFLVLRFKELARVLGEPELLEEHLQELRAKSEKRS